MVGIALGLFLQLTGVNALNMFSTRIFTKINANMKEPAFKANFATELIGYSFCAASALSLVIMQRFSRKQVYVVGQSVVVLFLAGVVGSIHFEQGVLCLICILGVVITAMSTINPAHWVYVPEILNDRQFSFVCTIHYMAGILLSIGTEPLVKYLHPEGAFTVFLSISALAILFITLCFKDTQGLTDMEKKQLYSPCSWNLPHQAISSDSSSTEIDLETQSADLSSDTIHAL